MTETKRNDYHHVMPLQIRFNDVDKFGHVNNTVYFQFYDTTKTDYIATVCKGVDWERLALGATGHCGGKDRGRVCFPN